MTSAANLYKSVIDDVVANVRDAFQDEAVDEAVLMELKTLWEAKLTASRTVEQTPTRPVAGASHMPHAVGRHDQHHQQQASNGASSSQFMVTASNRLMPVQITIPAQPGHPNSVPKALTVQVPAHALQPGSQTSPILQQVLTQAITQALNLQDSMQAALYLQGQINNAFKLDI